MADELVVTLLAEEGKKFVETGEAIASHGRSLVFLPKGAEPGKQVRVRLQEIKEQSNDREVKDVMEQSLKEISIELLK